MKQDSVADPLTAQVTGDVNGQLSSDTSPFEKMGFKKVQMEEGLIAGEVTMNADGTAVTKVNTVLTDTLEQTTAAGHQKGRGSLWSRGFFVRAGFAFSAAAA